MSSGNNVLIAGFVITGDANTAKPVLIRAVGPSLASQGVAQPLASPVITLSKYAAPQSIILGSGSVVLAKDKAAISVYARNRDYHDVIKGRLKEIATRFAARSKEDVKVFVDTAPVMEKPLAGAAGLGWQGKHTNLVSRTFGSWLFLGSMFTTAELEADQPEVDHCGSCRACLDACPTAAFPAPYQLDARRCISYLTIELKGAIPEEFRPLIGNRIYGCDDCQLACPWNKFAQRATVPDFDERNGLGTAGLIELFGWSEIDFNRRLEGSPIRRIGHERWLRNLAVGLGNAATSDEIVAALRARADHPSALVREHVAWALARHGQTV